MGRCAKHLTRDSKRAANQLSVTKYRQTPPGKTMLAAQCDRQYHHKGAQSSRSAAGTSPEPSPDSPPRLQPLSAGPDTRFTMWCRVLLDLPSLPASPPPSPPPSPPHIPLQIPHLPPLGAAIDEHSQLPLPTDQPFFRDALLRSDRLDLSDIGRWKKEPPFEDDNDPAEPQSDAYRSYTRSLGFVLHGTRLREQHERDVQRWRKFKEGDLEEAMSGLRDEVRAMLEGWERA
ncbi:hypothetical protein DFH07DRAFT_778984 [Mycena maculata]|uniref:Uncharacterized protein n=1 Tax=Mycena maculata TaxID=230809 RepID=A0AAD7IAJ8_9AGAR|nr:hypothetical protein DFH07DRAFT_778984 [Mycena maculata]